MSDQKLCWKCRYYLKEKYGANFYMVPSNHCHHDEPAEEPKKSCEWCEKYELIIDAFKNTPTRHVIDYLISGGSERYTNCPVCKAKI